MGKNRRLWVDEITDVLKELGGKAALADIRKKVKERGVITYKESSIPRTLERYCSDCDRFCGKQDSFYIIEKNGRKKIWGLRGYNTKDSINSSTYTGIRNDEFQQSDSFSHEEGESSILLANKPYDEDDFDWVSEDKTEYSDQKSKKRIGQNEFRNKVLKAYEFKCCVPNETCTEVLQAAHIQAYVNEDSNPYSEWHLL